MIVSLFIEDWGKSYKIFGPVRWWPSALISLTQFLLPAPRCFMGPIKAFSANYIGDLCCLLQTFR